jgi:membrane-associated phospholipid phosphatase
MMMLFTQSKWIVTVLFGVFIIWRHDAEALWFAGGSILNAMFSISLKHLLNQKRPSSLKSDPGMPSSHAQSIFFTVIFIILSSNLSHLLFPFKLSNYTNQWFLVCYVYILVNNKYISGRF